MKIVQSGRFARSIKRLHPNEKTVLDDVVRALILAPDSGEMKIGDLVGIRVMKFKLGNQLKLLAYTHTEETLTLLAYGSHENFYRDLKL